MIPVRYWLTTPGDLPLADLLNSGNFMFWRTGPSKYFPNDPPKGWVKHTRKGQGHVSFPYASFDSIKCSGAKRFLRRRARQLPRSGGEYLVLVRIEKVYNDLFFCLGMAHHRCRGASAIADFPTWGELPQHVPWVMYGSSDFTDQIQKFLPEKLPCS